MYYCPEHTHNLQLYSLANFYWKLGPGFLLTLSHALFLRLIAVSEPQIDRMNPFTCLPFCQAFSSKLVHSLERKLTSSQQFFPQKRKEKNISVFPQYPEYLWEWFGFICIFPFSMHNAYCDCLHFYFYCVAFVYSIGSH